jgi:hypothetical protein
VITDLITSSALVPGPGAGALEGVRFGCGKLEADPTKGGTGLENLDPKDTESCGFGVGYSSNIIKSVEGAPYVAIGFGGALQGDGLRCARLISAPLLMANAAVGGNPVKDKDKKYSDCISLPKKSDQNDFPDLLCLPGEVMTGAKFAMDKKPFPAFGDRVVGVNQILCKKVELK